METNQDELLRRMHRDLIDSYDEELEMELDDRLVDAEACMPRARATPTERPGNATSASCSACRASW